MLMLNCHARELQLVGKLEKHFGKLEKHHVGKLEKHHVGKLERIMFIRYMIVVLLLQIFFNGSIPASRSVQ